MMFRNRHKIVDKQIMLDPSEPKADMLEFSLSQMVFGEKAIFQASLLSSITGAVLVNKTLVMEGEDYQGWNDDIPYIRDWVVSKMDVTLIPETPPNP